MNNGNDFEVGKIIDLIKTDSLSRKLGTIEGKLGSARINGDIVQIRELEKQRAELIAEMNPVVNIEAGYPAQPAEAAYHGLAGKIVRAIEPHTEAASIALLMNLLTAFGNVIGRSAYYLVGLEKHYLKLFLGLVGITSKGRKGSSWQPIRTLFESIESDWTDKRIQTGLSSGEGLISHVRDDMYKTIINKETRMREEVHTDIGIEDKRLLLIESELGQTLKVLNREANTLSPILRCAWDSGTLQTMTKLSPLKATGSHISIIGHITKDELQKGLKDAEKGNGFANRFLWVCVDRSQSLPFGGAFDTVDLDSLSASLDKAVRYAQQTGEITWAEETRELWADAYPELSEGKQGMIGAITARAEAQVVRLASIYALLDLSNEIEPAHLQAAFAVWEYSEASVRYIFQETTPDPLAEKIYHILIDNPQGMGRLEISNALGRHYSSNHISEALELLSANDLASSRQIKTSGRPKEVWESVIPTKESSKESE